MSSDEDLVIEAFTELAPRYEETVDRELRQFWGIGYRDFLEAFIERMPATTGDRILDVATGKGIIPEKIARQVDGLGQIVGLDITPAMLQHAHESLSVASPFSPINLICGSAMELPFSADVFDLAVCGLGMHHMDALRLLGELKRVLRHGGKLAMADVGASAFWRSRAGRLFLQFLLIRYGLTHEGARVEAERQAFDNIYTADEWRSLLETYGFSDIDITIFKAIRPWYPSALIIRATAN